MDRITFHVNKDKCSVGSEVDSDTSLNDYIRNHLNLRGTKYMCKEGGCGSCVVAVTVRDPHPRTFSVNSCLVSVTSCQDWEVTTIEGIGDRSRGYHPVQKTLAEYNGTQCGYCSPGFVMSMYSLLQANHYDLTQYEIENSFGSNTCRCTGSRPILDAFKSFAKDAPKPQPKSIQDIEDLKTCKGKEDCHGCNKDWCMVKHSDAEHPRIKKIDLKDGHVWYRVNEISDIFTVLDSEGYDSYMLVNGNTGRGAVPILFFPRVLIDIKPIKDLTGYFLDQNLVIGAGITLTDLMELFKNVSKAHEEFQYLYKLYEHLDLVAHIPVRNIGTVAGNLMTKHRLPAFSSDIFLLLETIKATLVIVHKGSSVEVTPEEFLALDMSGRVITQVKIPPYSQRYQFVSFKIMPRAQNAHAQVNAAFLYEFDEHDKDVVLSARIVIGGLSGKFVHAHETEKFLHMKKIFTNEVLQQALKTLEGELIVEEIAGEMKPAYRKKCALGLFYKGLLVLIPKHHLKPWYRSGARDFRKTRPLSKGSEVYDTNPIIWPINEPMPKIDALIQCAGESKYCNDLPTQPKEVFCAFVTSDICTGEIESIDATPALKIPGVLAFFSAKDIPGKNSFLSQRVPTQFVPEEVFAERYIKYYDQPVGLLVAETERLAYQAALLVKINYKVDKKKPILTIKDAREREPERVTLFLVFPARSRGTNVQRILKGTDEVYAQYVFHMENQTVVTRPSEDGLDVIASTQWLDSFHICLSEVLNIPQNRINITVPRNGGAYGMKITRANHTGAACALVTHLMDRPCRFVMSIQANLRVVGKRLPCTRDFEVGVSNSGEIQYLEYHIYEDNGYVVSDGVAAAIPTSIKNCYDNRRWQFKIFNVTTDTASNSFARAPGSLEAIAMTETIMERISYELERDPSQVRINNLEPTYVEVREMIQTLLRDAEYDKRKNEIQNYNKLNRWKKKGLRVAFMSWPVPTVIDYNVFLSVYHGDATVVIHHGGIEMGQGINTKVIQTVAYTLNIPIEKIKCKPPTVSINPNVFATGGSRTTECVCFGAIKCCQIILDRLTVVRETLTDPTWEILIEAAFNRGINLQTSYRVTSNDQVPYRSGGACLAEVELDILTGEHEILRVDIIEDVGTSINPELDIGQIEGAFMMGVGYWTHEELIYDEKTGELLTDRTWYYKVPLTKDIPIDFRIQLRRNSYNPIGTLGARAVAEPPTCLSISVAFALREAIAASRENTGYPKNKWFDVVGSEVDSDTSLNDYIRNHLNLRGTKYMCKEGGCGACVVAVTVSDPHPRTFSVNSCLVSVTSCQDWEVTTIEGIGDRSRGYHPVQKTLAEYNGTQCGYCSPGFVMSMYSLLEANHYDLTQYEIENSFGSNTCRCTGSRPILDAFKSFAKDAPKPKPKSIQDIEDLKICGGKKDCHGCNKDWCMVKNSDTEHPRIKKIDLKDGHVWYRVNEISDIFTVLDSEGYDSYMLVNGNTGRGAVPILFFPRVLIDIKPIKDLTGYFLDQNLVIGAGITLTDLMELFKNVSKAHEEFQYLYKLYEHLDLVAHIPVRNIGTVAGNLMTKHRLPEFSSDIFLLLETIKATLVIVHKGSSVEVTPEEFLALDMTGRVMTRVKIPPYSHRYQFVSFKIMPRAQNAHAQVNAAFLYEFDEHDKDVVLSARIVIGGLSGKFVHAHETEKFLHMKKIFTNEVLQQALKTLEGELIVEEIAGEMKPAYRKKCALGLFYKGLLVLIPKQRLKPWYRSGARDFRKTRPLSKGSEVYDTNPIIWPVNEPMPKIDALIQCAGESMYCNDLPTQPKEVFCAFVTSDICTGEIESIDATPALKMPGVLAFFSAKDIPGKNSFLSQRVPTQLTPEEVFVEKFIKYYDQPIGLIVAETERLANQAALLVKINYKVDKKKPILTIKDAREREPERVTLFLVFPARSRGTNVQRIFKGTDDIYAQYVFHMENQTVVTRPSEDGIDVLASTQFIDSIHIALSEVLNIPQNRINITVPRNGGAYGMKITRANHTGAACALVTHLMDRPCRFVMSIQANLRVVGKRLPCTRDFEVGVSSSGEIQYLEYHLYEDNGYVVSDNVTLLVLAAIKNCYDNRRWQYKIFNVTTDTASNSFARAPGSLEAISMTEKIMERISYEIDRDPTEVRINNLEPTYVEVREMIQTLLRDAEYDKRKNEIQNYNKLNRWKKKGLRVAFMSWPVPTIIDYNVFLSVYHGDATVVIHHGGIEMGQGINTKVIQTVAYTLNIPIEKIKCKPPTASTNPNVFATGSSRTTQCVCFGAIKCCQIILDRLTVVRETLTDPTWEILIEAAFNRGINLQASYRVTSNDQVPYRSGGVCLTEVELDILTGEHEILRVDIIEDVGTSINPELDIGQIEGAFMMGIGYWTHEELIFDEKTGELLTDRTWYYKVPLTKDIPIDFRIQLRRNSYNPIGTLGARAVAEPPTCLSISVAFALREAIAASRENTGYPKNKWFDVDGPFTLAVNVLKADARLDEFLFN